MIPEYLFFCLAAVSIAYVIRILTETCLMVKDCLDEKKP